MVLLFSKCRPAYNFLTSYTDLKKKWSQAVEWLSEELDRVIFHLPYCDLHVMNSGAGEIFRIITYYLLNELFFLSSVHLSRLRRIIIPTGNRLARYHLMIQPLDIY